MSFSYRDHLVCRSSSEIRFPVALRCRVPCCVSVVYFENPPIQGSPQSRGRRMEGVSHGLDRFVPCLCASSSSSSCFSFSFFSYFLFFLFFFIFKVISFYIFISRLKASSLTLPRAMPRRVRITSIHSIIITTTIIIIILLLPFVLLLLLLLLV